MDTSGLSRYTIRIFFIISASASIDGDHLHHDPIPYTNNSTHILHQISSTTRPRPPSPPPARLWKWWVTGFGVALLGLILVGLGGVAISKGFASMRIRWMERKSEESEADLETRWIGDSRMPSAAMVRTQATLESECAI